MKKAICSFLSLLLISGTLMAQTKVIAHRGYWDCNGSAQNSIASLQKAQEIGIYGSECDVYLTADGVLVLNHDETHGTMVVEETKYKQLKKLKLNNEEILPTFKSYLKQGLKDKNTKLIVEIKSHKDTTNEDRCVKEVVKMVKKYKMEGQVKYISFSKRACANLISLSPTTPVAYLGSDVAPKELKALGFSGVDFSDATFDKHPEWIAEAKACGLTINVWTIDKEVDMQRFINLKVDYITTNNPLLLKGLLR